MTATGFVLIMAAMDGRRMGLELDLWCLFFFPKFKSNILPKVNSNYSLNVEKQGVLEALKYGQLLAVVL